MESGETIQASVQAACDIQEKRFSNRGSFCIICDADIRVVV